MSRGGRRPGGGRKPLPPEQRRIVLSCRVKPETFDAICREAGQGSIGRLLDEIFITWNNCCSLHKNATQWNTTETE